MIDKKKFEEKWIAGIEICLPELLKKLNQNFTFCELSLTYTYNMKIRLIKRKSIEDFALQHARSRSSFQIWLTLLQHANWNEPADIAATFGSANLLGNGSNRVVFDIAGNNYRMICKYHFGIKMLHLYIKWIGTHATYTALCDKNEQYTVNIY